MEGRLVNASGEMLTSSSPVHVATLSVCTVLTGFVMTMGCVGNGVVILKSLQNWKSRSCFGPLIFNLAASDFIVCSCLSPVFLVFLFRTPPTPRIFCGAFLFLGTVCTLLSLFSLVAIALHGRCVVSRRQGKGGQPSVQVVLVLTAIWLISLGVAVAGIIYVNDIWTESLQSCKVTVVGSSQKRQFDFALSFLAPVCALSFIAIATSCVIIAWIAQIPRCWKRTQDYPLGTDSGVSGCCFRPMDRDTRTLYFIAILTACLCWGPVVISQFISLFSGESVILYQLKLCGIALVFLNSALHPYLYTEPGGRMRQKYRRLLHAAVSCGGWTAARSNHSWSDAYIGSRTKPPANPQANESVIDMVLPGPLRWSFTQKGSATSSLVSLQELCKGPSYHHHLMRQVNGTSSDDDFRCVLICDNNQS